MFPLDPNMTRSATAAPNKLLQTFTFGAVNAPASYMFGSWLRPEETCTWALTPGCGLSIPMRSCDESLAVLIDIAPATRLPDRPSRRMVVSVRGREVLDLEVRNRGVFLIPVGTVHSGESLELTFGFDEALDMPGETIPLAIVFYKAWIIEYGHMTAMPMINVPSLVQETSEDTKAVVEALLGKALADFLMKFESLGHSCDFGIFQRECGADPLGLLRFAGITTPKLVEGLIDRFALLALPGTVEANVVADWNNEYCMFDKSYGIASRSFLTPAQAAPDQLIAREMKRLPFLKEIFLETVDQAGKTFVLRRPDQMHPAEAEAVIEVLRLKSDCKLLWAVHEQGGVPGSLDVISPYFFRGHLDTTHGLGSASISAWLSICATAHRVMAFYEGRSSLNALQGS